MTTTTAAAATTKAPQATLTAVLCFAVALLEGYDLQVISSAGPYLVKLLQLRPQQMGWLFSASLIGLAAGAIGGGWLADRYGRKPALIGSVLVLGAFTLATAYANSFESLMVIRILAGVGLGGAMPTLIALVAEVSGGHKTTSAVTTMICGQPLGGIVSALVGQTIAAKYGWQSLFVVGGALTVLVVPLLMLGLPETKPATAGARSARMPTLQALFGEGRAPASLLLWAVFILTLALLSVLLSWTPLLVMGKGLPKPVGLNAIIAINVGGIVGGLVISRLIDRWGVRWPMLSLYVITGVSLYLFARVQSETMLLLVAGFVGLGVLGAQFSLYGIAPRLYPLAGRGSGVGVAVAMGRIGSILGPVVIGGLISRGSTESETVMVMAPVGLTAGVALVLLTLAARQALAAGARAH
jgi:AAHS family 3-hydroxyphenylpropionic acid transporter